MVLKGICLLFSNQGITLSLECKSGKFLLVNDFEKKADIAVDTSVYILDTNKLREWFEKKNIDETDRVFCIDKELEVIKEVAEKLRLIVEGKTVLETK